MENCYTKKRKGCINHSFCYPTTKNGVGAFGQFVEKNRDEAVDIVEKGLKLSIDNQ